ncbi:hypothetical protein, partial [Xanthomonas citri]
TGDGADALYALPRERFAHGKQLSWLRDRANQDYFSDYLSGGPIRRSETESKRVAVAGHTHCVGWSTQAMTRFRKSGSGEPTLRAASNRHAIQAACCWCGA